MAQTYTQQANDARYHYTTHGYATACGRTNVRTIVLDREVDCVLCLVHMAMRGVMLTAEQRDRVNHTCCTPRRRWSR